MTETVSDPMSPDDAARVFLAPSHEGAITAVWVEDIAASSQQWRVLAATRSATGVWEPVQDLSGVLALPGGAFYLLDVASDDAGNVTAAWVEYDGTYHPTSRTLTASGWGSALVVPLITDGVATTSVRADVDVRGSDGLIALTYLHDKYVWLVTRHAESAWSEPRLVSVDYALGEYGDPDAPREQASSANLRFDPGGSLAVWWKRDDTDVPKVIRRTTIPADLGPNANPAPVVDGIEVNRATPFSDAAGQRLWFWGEAGQPKTILRYTEQPANGAVLNPELDLALATVADRLA